MFAASIIAAALVTLPPPAQVQSGTLVSHSQAYAHTIVLKQTSTPQAASKDHKWDGALAGAAAGAGGGALAGLVFYGRGGGEWPSQGEFMAATTLFGTLIGGVTGLVIDLIRR